MLKIISQHKKVAYGVGVLIALVAAGGLAVAAGWYVPKKTIAGYSGPALPRGISAQVLGEIDLADQIEGLENYSLRTRYWTIKPGGVVPLHDHRYRFATIYVLKGEIYEHRSDQETPVKHEADGISIEADVSHWWKNESDSEVLLVATDLCPHKEGQPVCP